MTTTRLAVIESTLRSLAAELRSAAALAVTGGRLVADYELALAVGKVMRERERLEAAAWQERDTRADVAAVVRVAAA